MTINCTLTTKERERDGEEKKELCGTIHINNATVKK
jgi:hypothetical protein